MNHNRWLILFSEKRKQYEDDGLINDNESDAEAGSALKKQRKPKKKKGTYKIINSTFDYLSSKLKLQKRMRLKMLDLSKMRIQVIDQLRTVIILE